MPRYFYRCNHCEQEFKAVHGMSESLSECKFCSSSKVVRIPQMTTIAKPQTNEAKRVHEAIEDNKQIFKEMEKEARNQFYDD